MMNANIESTIRSAITGKRRYTFAMLAMLLLGSSTPASLASQEQSLPTKIRTAQTLKISEVLLAEATPAPATAPATVTSSSSSSADDNDKDSKKQKKKQDKQAEKDADEAAKAAKEKAKADAKAAKKDDKVSDKKSSDKDSKDKDSKSKKDDKDSDKSKSGKAADAGKTKTVVVEGSTSSDKASDKGSSSSHKVITETTTRGAGKNTIVDEEKKEADESKTADTEMKSEALPTYAPDSALISVLKDLNRSLKNSEEFTKIEDQSQKAIVEIAHQALQKALENPQLIPNRIVEKVGKENLMPPMGTEAWSSGELDLGDKNKASLSVVWAKRENGLLSLTIAGNCPNEKAPNGKKIGEFIVLLTARSPVDNGFDIQSQQNVSFWLGKISSIAVESDCCAPPPAAPAEGASDADKKPKEVSSEAADVKKKSLTVLPTLLTSRRREYLAALMSVEKHNALVAEKLQEISLAKEQKESGNAADAKEVSSAGTFPAGAEGKTMQEAYERALRSVAQEYAKMKGSGAGSDSSTAGGATVTSSKESASASKTENDKKSSDTVSGDNAASKEILKPTAVATKTAGTNASTVGGATGTGAPTDGAVGTPGTAGTSRTGGTSGTAGTNVASGTNTVAGSNATSSTSNSGTGTASVSQAIEKTVSAAHPSSVTPAVIAQTTSQPQTTAINPSPQPPILQSAAPGGASAPPTIAMAPGGNTVGFAAANDMAAFRSVRQPSVGALVMIPERALAGQSVTITIYDAKRNPESAVELSLNGTAMLTNLDGQVAFTIPEDATPGRSLNVELSARPEQSPSVIDILQPLIVPSEKQNPSIEKVMLTGQENDTLVVDGHFFDGIAQNNKIMIDGQQQGRVAAASPVQLRISLPVTLQGGDHVIAISCEGLNSNPSIFVTQSAPITVSPPEKKRTKQPTTKYRY
jgi:hypothetical protein